jgi:hypothetical protein
MRETYQASVFSDSYELTISEIHDQHTCNQYYLIVCDSIIAQLRNDEVGLMK